MAFSRRTWLTAATVVLANSAFGNELRRRPKPTATDSGFDIGGSDGSSELHRKKVPEWRRRMASRTWAPISRHVLADINPARSREYNLDYPNAPVWERRDPRGVTGDQDVIAPWCGAVWDEQQGNFWLPLGGGHSDYGGNEAYRICLYNDDPRWTMPKPPSGSKPYIDKEGIPPGATPLGKSYLLDDHREITGVYADGRPRATHSYNKIVYVPGVGPVMIRQGSTFAVVDANESTKWTWRYNEAINEWEFKGTPDIRGMLAGTGMGGGCYDPDRHCAYWVGNADSHLCRIDLRTWEWSRVSRLSMYHPWQVKLIKLPDKDRLLEINLKDMAVWDCGTGDRTVIAATGPGPAPLNNQFGDYGWDWCQALGCIVCWPGHPGSTRTVYALTPGKRLLEDLWTWSVLPTAAGGLTPPSAAPHGTYGRFAYSSRLNGFMLLTSRLEPVWFFALG